MSYFGLLFASRVNDIPDLFPILMKMVGLQGLPLHDVGLSLYLLLNKDELVKCGEETVILRGYNYSLSDSFPIFF